MKVISKIAPPVTLSAVHASAQQILNVTLAKMTSVLCHNLISALTKNAPWVLNSTPRSNFAKNVSSLVPPVQVLFASLVPLVSILIKPINAYLVMISPGSHFPGLKKMAVLKYAGMGSIWASMSVTMGMSWMEMVVAGPVRLRKVSDVR